MVWIKIEATDRSEQIYGIFELQPVDFADDLNVDPDEGHGWLLGLRLSSGQCFSQGMDRSTVQEY